MVNSCAAYNCTNRATKDTDLSFHKFPLGNKERLQLWLNQIRRENFVPTVHSVMCSKHFENDNYWKNGNKKLLKPNAIPTIFDFPESVKVKKHVPRPAPIERKFHTEKDVQGESGTSSQPSLECVQHDHAYDTGSDKKLLKYQQIIEHKTKSIKKYKARFENEAAKSITHKKQVNTMHQLIQELKEKCSIVKKVEHLLENTFSDIFVELVSLAQSGRNAGYSSKVKNFALTLYFHSPAAYKFVRKSFENTLPHPTTLRRWYSVVDGNPGFTAESFVLIKELTSRLTYPVYGCLTFDEMSIRKGVIWDGQEFVGYVNMGQVHCEGRDEGVEAKEALVIMLIAVNAAWKVPLGYFLLDGISGSDKCCLIRQSITLLHGVNVNVISVTCDGLSSNVNMANELGCNFNISNFKSSFKHPVTGENIYLILDVCHMMKLARNVLGDYKVLIDKEGEKIKWQYIVALHSLQEVEGLTLANKLRKNHVLFTSQKMKVNLAVQLLSASVAKSLQFLEEDLKHPDFTGCKPIIKYCVIFDRLFDIGNSKNSLAKGYKCAVTLANFHTIDLFLREAEDYILNLRREDGQLMRDSPRKTFILGFMTLIHAVRGLHFDILVNKKLKYVPFYKASQDHIEMFFACIRGRLGWNNNPNVLQFKAAYKQLLVQNDITVNNSGNCTSQDTTVILQLHRKVTLQLDPVLFSQNKLLGREPVESVLSDDELFSDCSLPPTLSVYVENVLVYIAGYVAGKVAKMFTCDICVESLFARNISLISHLFLNRKNNGGLAQPSASVVSICRIAEKNLRVVCSRRMKSLKDTIMLRILQECNFNILFNELHDHMLDNVFPENHVILLAKKIIELFIRLRFHHIAKSQNDRNKVSIRQKLNKTILFRNQ